MPFSWPYIITGLAIAIFVIAIILVIAVIVVIIIYVVIGPPPEPIGGGGENGGGGEITSSVVPEEFCPPDRLVPYYMHTRANNTRFVSPLFNEIGALINNGSLPVFHLCTSYDTGILGSDYVPLQLFFKTLDPGTNTTFVEETGFQTTLISPDSVQTYPISTPGGPHLMRISNPSNNCTAPTYQSLKGTYVTTGGDEFRDKYPYNQLTGFTDLNGFSMYIESNFEGYNPIQTECL